MKAIRQGFIGIVAVMALTVSLPNIGKGEESLNFTSLKGEWEGQWNADDGSNGRFQLEVLWVEEGTGHIKAKRRFTTQSPLGSPWLVTTGAIEGDEVVFGFYKGKKRWIRLNLSNGSDGRPRLNGSYSVGPPKSQVYTGTIRSSKLSAK